MLRLLKMILCLLLLSQPIFVYLATYFKTDCDDKAVHYFCAAMTYSSGENRQAILENLPDWTNQLDSVYLKQRFTERIQGWYNYPAMSVLIYAQRNLKIHSEPNASVQFSSLVKRSSLMMLLFSLIALGFVCYQTKFSVWPILIILNLAAFNVFNIPYFAETPIPQYHPFTGFSPRASGILFVLAALLCISARKNILALLSIMLLVSWHIGSAFLVITILLIALIMYQCLIFLIKSLKGTLEGNAFFRLFLLAGLFIVSLHFVATLSQFNSLQVILTHLIPTHLVKEIPARLGGINYLVANTFIVGGYWLVWNIFSTHTRRNRRVIVTTLFSTIIFFLIAKVASCMEGLYPDLWGHIVSGLEHLSSGALPRSDLYSYTAVNAPFINHAWLSELIFAYGWTAYGMTGLWALRLILAGVIFGLILRCISGSTQGCWSGLLVFLLCSIAMSKNLMIRPLMFSATFYALFLFITMKIFVEEKWNQKIAWFFVPLMILWTNLHGGFIIGICFLSWLTFCILTDCLRKKENVSTAILFLVVFVLAGFVSLLNPYGFGLWKWIIFTLSSSRNILISEWAPAYRYYPQFSVIIFYFLNALTIFSFIKTPVKRNLFEWGLLVAVCLSTWLNIRHEVIFCITAAMILPKHIEAIFPGLKSPTSMSRGVINFSFLFCLLSAIGIHLLPGHHPNALQTPNHPVNAIRFIKKNDLKGNLLVSFDWSQLSIWYLKDSCKVAFDGRLRTVYPLAIEEDYFHFHNFTKQWSNIIDRYKTQMILVPGDWAGLAELKQSNDWILTYTAPLSTSTGDNSKNANQSILFIRKNAFPDIEKRLKEGRLYYPEIKTDFTFGEVI